MGDGRSSAARLLPRGPSSRKAERWTHDEQACYMLAGNTRPDHLAIRKFPRRYHSAVAVPFVERLKLCKRKGGVKLGNSSILWSRSRT